MARADCRLHRTHTFPQPEPDVVSARNRGLSAGRLCRLVAFLLVASLPESLRKNRPIFNAACSLPPLEGPATLPRQPSRASWSRRLRNLFGRCRQTTILHWLFIGRSRRFPHCPPGSSRCVRRPIVTRTNVRADRRTEASEVANCAGMPAPCNSDAALGTQVRGLEGRVISQIEQIVGRKGICLSLVEAMRLHQWAKNLLVFAPLILAGKTESLEAWTNCLLGFLALGILASSTYLLNDVRTWSPTAATGRSAIARWRAATCRCRWRSPWAVSAS